MPVIVLLVASVGVLLAGWPDGAARRTIRIATSPWPGYEYLHLAQKRGFFKELDADVQLVEFDSIADARRAFQRGQVDGLTCTLVEAALLREKTTRGPRAVLFTDYSVGADVLFGAPNIECIADLRGKSIAVDAGAFDVLVVAAALRTAQLTLDDVTLVTMPKQEMQEALRSGLVAAVPSFPPYSLAIESAVPCRRIFDTSCTPELILSCVVISAEAAEAHAADLLGIVDAFCRAVEWSDANRREANAFMAAREHITPEAFEKALAEIRILRRHDLPRQLAPDGPVAHAIALTTSVLAKCGMLASPDPDPAIIASQFSLEVATR